MIFDRKKKKKKKKSRHFGAVVEEEMMASDPKLKAEIGPDGLAREAPVIAYTEKVIFSK